MASTPAGDFDYEVHGHGYAMRRRTDPRIASLVHDALGGARTVLNVGAGAGSYEPEDRYVVAVEPAAATRAQRPGHLAPAIDAAAEDLPFDDRSFDAAMAAVAVHQWADVPRGLASCAEWRAVQWSSSPDLLGARRAREVRPVPVPIDCLDGFVERAARDPGVGGSARRCPAMREAGSPRWLRSSTRFGKIRPVS